jgi:UDP-N-acetylglucosamine 2-epimerase
MKVMTVLGTRPEIIRLSRVTATQTLTAGQNAVIEVTATDRPGHKTTKTQTK